MSKTIMDEEIGTMNQAGLIVYLIGKFHETFRKENE